MKQHAFVLSTILLSAAMVIGLHSSQAAPKPKLSLAEKIVRIAPLVPAVITAGTVVPLCVPVYVPNLMLKIGAQSRYLALWLGIVVAGGATLQALRKRYFYTYAADTKKQELYNEIQTLLGTAAYGCAAVVLSEASVGVALGREYTLLHKSMSASRLLKFLLAYPITYPRDVATRCAQLVGLLKPSKKNLV